MSLSGAVVARAAAAMTEAKAKLAAIATEIAEAVRRWEELETIAPDAG